MSHSPDSDADGGSTPRPPHFHSSPAPSPANADAAKTTTRAKSPAGNTLQLPAHTIRESTRENEADDEPKDASAVELGVSVMCPAELDRKGSSSTDDSASSPPIDSSATPPRVISAAQSRRGTLKNIDAFKSVLQAQKPTETMDGSAVTNAPASNLEADLQLAGQIGEALLAENGKLETLVDELTTALQDEYEAKQAVLEENEELKAQLEEMANSAVPFNLFSPVAAGSPSATTRADRPRQLDTRTTGGGEESSLGFSDLTDEPSGQEDLLNAVVAFLRTELGSQSSSLQRSTPTNSGSSMMIGLGEQRMNSPSQHNGSLTSPSHDRSFSSASTFSTSPAAPLNPALLLEDLNAVLRKLRKERRVAELEKSNCAALVTSMEKQVAAANAWVAEHQADVNSVAALREQVEKLQMQLEASQSQAKEDAATASVEAKLKLQQAKRHLETSMQQLEEELRLDRQEAAALLAQRNELARKCNSLEQQLEQDQEAMRQAQLENQTLKHSHEQLASLTSQLRDELERSMAEADSQIQQRDGQIAALTSSSSQGTQEVVDLRRELARAESELATTTQAHIAQLAAITNGFDRKIADAVAAVEQRAAEALLYREAELLAAQDAALMAQRTSIEQQLESQRAETEKAIATQTVAFLEKQKRSMFGNYDDEAIPGKEEVVLECADLTSPDAAAALRKKEAASKVDLGFESELPPADSISIQVMSMTSPQSAGTASSAEDGAFLSPISNFATSGSPPSSASSIFSPAGSSCSSNRSTATPVHFNLSLKHLQLKFPPTPASAAAPAAASSSTKHQPIVAPLSALMRSPPVQCCSETQTSPLPAAHDSEIRFTVDAPVVSNPAQATVSAVFSPEPASSSTSGSSPASRARLMESPMLGQHVASSSSSQAFVAASPNKTNRHFHAMHSAAAATLSAAGALPPRSPAQPVRATTLQQQQVTDSSTQHRLALLSSVGKALSVVTGSSPVNTLVGSTPPAPIGRSPLPSLSPSAPNVAAALSKAMTPKSSAAAKATAAKAGPMANSIYVLPLPPFAVSPSDQLALAYLYRYLHATWVQSFSWLESSPCKDRALWIRDELAGHCFSCQKHWTLTSRRHHCRFCGGLFCATCSRFRLELPHSEPDSAQVRCCLRCFGAQQSMTMSNSLALWEQQGTLDPPAERSWIGSSFVLGSPAAKPVKQEGTQMGSVAGGRRGGHVQSSMLAAHSDATLAAAFAETSSARSTAGEVDSDSDRSDDDDGQADSSDEYGSTDDENDDHGAVLDDEHSARSKFQRQPQTVAAQTAGRVPA